MRAKRSRRACGGSAPTTSTSTSCTTRAWTRSSATTCSRSWSACKDEGKLRHYGVALGPAIGWRDEGLRALEERDIASVQTVYNVLEQEPGRDFLAAAERKGAAVLARVPTSSGLLEDKYTLETTFPKHDHRSHRPREWLVEGLQKVERLRFLCEEHGITMAQAALRFILAQQAIACVLPTVADRRGPRGVGSRLGRARPHSRGPRADLPTLYERNFDVEPVAARSGAASADRKAWHARVLRCPWPAARS